MTKLACTMDCDHVIEWGEEPETPGAALPHLAMIAHCPECEADQQITDICPAQVVVETVRIQDNDDNPVKTSIFYDAVSGTWGFCHSGIDKGLGWETDDETGYESQAAAREAAEADWTERMQEDERANGPSGDEDCVQFRYLG